MQHIPYNGGAPMTTAFVGGQLHAAFVTGLDGATLELGQGALPRRRARRSAPTSFRACRRSPRTCPASSVAWFGVLAPKGMPDDVAAKLHAAIAAAVARPEVRKLFTDRKIEAKSSTPAELEKIIHDEIAQWGPVISRCKIEMN